MGKLLTICENYANKWGLKFNESKSNISHLDLKNKHQVANTFIIQGEEANNIGTINTAKYLGIPINAKGICKTTLADKMLKTLNISASKLLNQIQNSKFNKKTRITIFNACCRAKIEYGSQITWFDKSFLNDLQQKYDYWLTQILGDTMKPADTLV